LNPIGYAIIARFRLEHLPGHRWWARQPVESTETSHSMCPAPWALTCSFFRMRAQVPLICQRRKSVYVASHGPYRSGMSRQGEPVLARHQIPSKHCRRLVGDLPLPEGDFATLVTGLPAATGGGDGRATPPSGEREPLRAAARCFARRE
jgi:hypothetical protein